MFKYKEKSIFYTLYAHSFSCYRTGITYGKRIADCKKPVKRMLYTNINRDFKRALKKAETGKWEDAITIWDKYKEHQNKSIAAKALYNISIAYEQQGYLNKALDIAEQSYQMQTIPHTFIHIDYLRKNVL